MGLCCMCRTCGSCSAAASGPSTAPATTSPAPSGPPACGVDSGTIRGGGGNWPALRRCTLTGGDVTQIHARRTPFSVVIRSSVLLSSPALSPCPRHVILLNFAVVVYVLRPRRPPFSPAGVSSPQTHWGIATNQTIHQPILLNQPFDVSSVCFFNMHKAKSAFRIASPAGPPDAALGPAASDQLGPGRDGGQPPLVPRQPPALGPVLSHLVQVHPPSTWRQPCFFYNGFASLLSCSFGGGRQSYFVSAPPPPAEGKNLEHRPRSRRVFSLADYLYSRRVSLISDPGSCVVTTATGSMCRFQSPQRVRQRSAPFGCQRASPPLPPPGWPTSPTSAGRWGPSPCPP